MLNSLVVIPSLTLRYGCMFAQILMTLYELLALHTWLFNAELEFHAAASPRFVALDNLGVGLLDI